MSNLISNIKIQGYRGLENLSIPKFGRVNLITGKNNSGKSSLLEAIRIFSAKGSPVIIQEILNYREENNDIFENEREVFSTDFGPYKNLFKGFPNFNSHDFNSHRASFSISAKGEKLKFQNVNISAILTKRITKEDGSIAFSPISDFFGDIDSIPAIEISVGEQKRIVPLHIRELYRRSIRHSLLRESLSDFIHCIYLDPFSSRSTGQLGVLWDSVALTDEEAEVVKALKLISPDIEAVSMIGSSESLSRSRTAIVRSKNFSSPVPLRTFGDGLNRLFGIVLSVCNAKNGILLIDEFENGLHHSVQHSIWETVFRLSEMLNVQVFASTHSEDCIYAFQQAASDSHEEGVLIRLARKDDIVFPTEFSEKELEIATRNNIEVR